MKRALQSDDLRLRKSTSTLHTIHITVLVQCTAVQQISNPGPMVQCTAVQQGAASSFHSIVDYDGATRCGRPTSPAASSAPHSGLPRLLPLHRRVVRPLLVQDIHNEFDRRDALSIAPRNEPPSAQPVPLPSSPPLLPAPPPPGPGADDDEVEPRRLPPPRQLTDPPYSLGPTVDYGARRA
jgi:hypothetical protein